MRFAHMADCHIGSWRDPKLRDAGAKAFGLAVDICMEKKVDFLLIAGDLFNTSFPRIDSLKLVAGKLRQLKERDIQVYAVPGSHDYSPSGKTIIDVLEEAGLLVNVFKWELEGDKMKLRFTIDKKTGVKLTGMLGRRGSLEKSHFEGMQKEGLENEQGYKIFLFHSGIDELKGKDMENVISHPISLLPKNFDYYAGGHVHIVEERKIEGYGRIAYPGPLFPNSFSELEKLGGGGFYIVEGGNAEWQPIQVFNVYSLQVNCDGKSPEQVKEEILFDLKKKEFNSTIVLIRVLGTLESGKPYDIDFREIFGEAYSRSAYFVMKSTSMVRTKEFEEILEVKSPGSDIEDALIGEHLGQVSVGGFDQTKERALIKSLMLALGAEKEEGETNSDFERRVKSELRNVLDMEL